MMKLIEVEIENKSYIKLLDLEKQQSKTLRLTTLVDSQSAVIIKVFLNISDRRIPIKEFNIRNLKPKASGLPRFELFSSYKKKVLHLELKVDGRKVENSDIKLASYFRNKLLPIFIILGLLFMFLLFSGGKWLFTNFISDKNSTAQTTINNHESVDNKTNVKKTADTKTETVIITEKPIQSDTKTETVIVTEKQEPVSIKNTENSAEIQINLHTAYFTPNNTTIQKEAANILKNLVDELNSLQNTNVEISGYCAMTGTEEGRERLSKERAYNVFAYLKSEGWVPETEPVIKWYGGTKPVTSNEDEIYRNRRVEISVRIP